MNISPLIIKSKIKKYEADFHSSLDFLTSLAELKNLVLVIDSQVAKLYKNEIKNSFGDIIFYQIEAKEENKNLNEAEKIYAWILENFVAKKNLNFVSIGGGITQDITGFVASTLFRGVNWRFVPTTLLAMVDSCIGGKTSLNFYKYKNILGTFYPPCKIDISSAFIPTLSQLDVSSGYGEIIKFLLMREFEQNNKENIVTRMADIAAKKSNLLEIIRECLEIKCTFMENDEFDQGRRNLLNYGHCFGHALETASGYYVPHGIAVNIGVIFSNIAAVNRKLISESQADFIIKNINLPYIFQVQRHSDYQAENLLSNLRNDKKRVGSGLPMVMPCNNGLVRVSDFSEEEFMTALAELKSRIFR